MGVGAQRSRPSGESRGGTVAESLSRQVLARVDSLADRLVLTIQESNPGYRGGRMVPEPDLWRSCHDNLTRILQLVGGAEARHGQEYYDAARATGRRRAEQGLPLDDLLRSFRMGGRLVWEALVAEARALRTRRRRPARRRHPGLGGRGPDLGAGRRRLPRRRAQRGPRRRAAPYLDLGGPAHRGRRGPGLRVRGRPGILEAPGRRALPRRGGRARVPRPRRRTPRLRDRLAAGRVESTWQARGAALVGLVLLAEPDPARELAALRDALEVRAGASSPVDGLEQVHAGFRQAALALRTLGPGDTVAALDERLPEAMLVQSPGARPAAGPEPGSARCSTCPKAERGPLLDTLDAWVETSGSAGRTAAPVHCHRNTVLNRLRRLSEATGHDLTRGVTPVGAGPGAARPTPARSARLLTVHSRTTEPRRSGRPGIPRTSDACHGW